MDRKEYSAIEMVRTIRDENAKRLKNKSHAERIVFYQECAKRMEKKIPTLLSGLIIAEGSGEHQVGDEQVQKKIKTDKKSG